MVSKRRANGSESECARSVERRSRRTKVNLNNLLIQVGAEVDENQAESQQASKNRALLNGSKGSKGSE